MRYSNFLFGLLFLLPLAASGQSAEEDAIKELFLEQFVGRWQAGDAEGLAALWHTEGDWMNLIGSRRIYKGPDQIKQVWSIGLQGRDTPESRRLVMEIDSIKMISPDIAQADLVMIFGHESTGVIQESMLAILQKEKNEWKILSSRVARIPK